jgi:hypothetical protein
MGSAVSLAMKKKSGTGPPLQILPEIRPSPDAGIVSLARPVDVADEEFSVANELKLNLYFFLTMPMYLIHLVKYLLITTIVVKIFPT